MKNDRQVNGEYRTLTAEHADGWHDAQAGGPHPRCPECRREAAAQATKKAAKWSELRAIRTREDADAIRAEVETVYDGWFADAERIEWDELLDHLERYGFDLGNDANSPAIQRIRAIVRELRAQS